MEAILTQDKTVLADIMRPLIRSKALLQDIQVHLDAILDARGAKASEIDNTVEEGSATHHEHIYAQVRSAQQILAKQDFLDASSGLTLDHIALLTKRQAVAVTAYVDQMSRTTNTRHHYDEGISFTPLCTPSSLQTVASIQLDSVVAPTAAQGSNDLILAHAYVRYMGDLSGGQHIVKRLSKLFPIYQSTTAHQQDGQPQIVGNGFEFYSFTSSGKTSMELKKMIRNRMDGQQLKEQDIVALVNEASLAFRLNRGLLDSLVDEESCQNALALDSQRNQQSYSYLSLCRSSLLMLLSSIHPHTLALLASVFALISAVSIVTLLH
jgi:hypothetical protein